MLGSHKLLLGGDHGLDTIVHVLDEVLLGAAESSLVGDVVGAVVGLGVLTVDTSDLNVVLVSDGLEAGLVLAEEWELDVDGSSHGGTQVGWAGGDVTKMLVVSELDLLLNTGSTTGESVKDGMEISTLLHGDDTELILLVNPDEESLVLVVEDTTTVWPVSVETASLKESISLPIKDPL